MTAVQTNGLSVREYAKAKGIKIVRTRSRKSKERQPGFLGLFRPKHFRR